MALTLRLNEYELFELEKIKKKMDVKTSSRAFSIMIESWINIQKSRDYWYGRCEEAEQENKKLKEKINNLQKAFADFVIDADAPF